MELIPNRYPICYIDYVDKLVPEEKITATKNVTINESFFRGHFPNNPVMPGVLEIESMVEAAKLMWDEPDLILTQVKRGRLREMVKPGMQLTIKVTAKEKYSCQAEVLIAERKACTADLKFKAE